MERGEGGVEKVKDERGTVYRLMVNRNTIVNHLHVLIEITKQTIVLQSMFGQLHCGQCLACTVLATLFLRIAQITLTVNRNTIVDLFAY